ncbi:MAG: IPT/TIG domain-containing protein [Patescibacteria group bacterium]|nr:IPT/TIG domain-containing protein [Patescibacteria group bacterium]
MKKTLFLVLVLALILVLPGCVQPNKKGQYTEFIRREGSLASENDIIDNSVPVYGVFPSEISVKGEERIRIYGANFEANSKAFINRPQFTLETIYLNPGLLEVWMPSYHQGMYKLGVVNQDGTYGYWSRLFRYLKEDEGSN